MTDRPRRAVARGRFPQVSVLVAVLCCLPAVAGAQTVDDLVARNLKAKGGAEKWRSIQTLKMSGTVTASGMDLPIVVLAKRPNLMRQEVTLQTGRIVQAYDGTRAWMVNPLRGVATPQVVTGPEAALARDQADFDGDLIDYKAKGNRVELVGPETIDGRKVDHLKVTRKNGTTRDIYLDADTGLDVRTSMTIDQNGQPLAITTDLSDYRPVDGIMVPFSVEQRAGGTLLAQITIQHVEFNLPLDAAAFQMPR